MKKKLNFLIVIVLSLLNNYIYGQQLTGKDFNLSQKSIENIKKILPVCEKTESVLNEMGIPVWLNNSSSATIKDEKDELVIITISPKNSKNEEEKVRILSYKRKKSFLTEIITEISVKKNILIMQDNYENNPLDLLTHLKELEYQMENLNKREVIQIKQKQYYKKQKNRIKYQRFKEAFEKYKTNGTFVLNNVTFRISDNIHINKKGSETIIPFNMLEEFLISSPDGEDILNDLIKDK